MHLLYDNFRYGVWKDFRGSTHRTHIWYIDPMDGMGYSIHHFLFLRTSWSKLCSPSAISATCFDMKFPLPKVWGFGPNCPSRCLDGGLVTTFSVAKFFMFVEVFVMRCSPWNLTIPVDAKKIQVCSYWSCSFDLGPKRQIVFNVGAKGCVSKFSWGDSPPTQTEKQTHTWTGIVYVGHYTFTPHGSLP